MRGPLGLTQLVSSYSGVCAWISGLSAGALWGLCSSDGTEPLGTSAKSPWTTEEGSTLPTVRPSEGLGLHTFELEEVLV